MERQLIHNHTEILELKIIFPNGKRTLPDGEIGKNYIEVLTLKIMKQEKVFYVAVTSPSCRALAVWNIE